MVESIGTATIKASDLRAIGAGSGVQRATAPIPVAEVAAVAKPSASTASAAPATLSSSMATEAPVDASRVQQIKTAIANGTFPLSPARITDQLIALKYDWMSTNEQA